MSIVTRKSGRDKTLVRRWCPACQKAVAAEANERLIAGKYLIPKFACVLCGTVSEPYRSDVVLRTERNRERAEAELAQAQAEHAEQFPRAAGVPGDDLYAPRRS